MRTNEHNLNSLRKFIRDLQQENEDLKSLLDQHHITYEAKNSLDESFAPDDYDEDQGARNLIPSRECAGGVPFLVSK